MQDPVPPTSDGRLLSALIQDKPLRLEDILGIGCQLAEALEAAHAAGAVRGNVTPASILIPEHGPARLLDAGAARGSDTGAINYWSPEQVRGEPFDARADLFSLGLVLYEMATGRQAFSGQSAEAVSDAILNRDAAPVRNTNPALPVELEHVITRALEKDPGLRYQTATDLLSELARLRRDSAAPSVAAPPPPAPDKSRVPIVAALVIIILGLAGFLYWRSSQPPSFAPQDTVVVADFENTTGDAVFDDTLRQAVSIQLQQTPFVTMLADQSVQRVMRLMSRMPDEPLTGDIARELCRRSGGKASVEGSIARLGTDYVVTVGVHDCQTGSTLAEEQAQASSQDDTLKQVGQAVIALRKRLGEPAGSIEQYNVPVTEATTPSIEALKAYSQALKIRQVQGDDAAVPFLERAIQLDPDFALAHVRLSTINASLGRDDAARVSAQKAYDLRTRASAYDRLYIMWSYAQRVAQDPAQARVALETMATTYPRDFAVRNNLGVLLIGQAQYEAALNAYTAAHDIAPDEPLPVSNSAYALIFLGRYDEAFAMVDRALALRPDAGLAITRWMMSRARNEARAAEYEAAARTLAPPAQLLFAESNLAIWEGRLSDYGKIVEQLRTQVGAGDPGALQGIDAAEIISMAMAQGGPWLTRVRALSKQPLPPQGLAQVAATLAITGQMDAVKSLAQQLDKADLNDPQQAQPLLVARVLLAGHTGRVAEATAMIESYLAKHPRSVELHYYLGLVRERNGLTAEAIESYRKTAGAFSVLGPSPAVSGAKLSLALLLKKSGDTAGAAAVFDELLKQWAHADEDFEPLRTIRKAR